MRTRQHQRLRRASAIAIPVLLFLSLVSWAFASPVGSSPDDNFHLPSIWCGLGEREGLCEDSGDADTRMVPTPVVTAPCFAFQPTQSAACWISDEDGMAEATWMNAVGLYPPLFFATMGTLAGHDVSVSVIAMRVFNSGLVVGLLTAVFYALPRKLRPALVISALVTSVPLGAFVIASNNPSSWAFAAAATIWVSLYGMLRTTGRRQLVLGGLAVFAAILGAGARADASIYAVFAVLLAALLGIRKGVRLLIPGIAAGLVVVVSAVVYLTAGQSSTLASGLPTQNPPLTGAQHLANLLGLPALWFGVFGPSGLGWLDTVPPWTVAILAFSVFAASIFIGIDRLQWRRGVAVGLAFAALWAVPFVLLAQSHAVVGTEVQSRYLLPLMVLLAGVASAGKRSRPSWRGPRSFVAAAALAMAMSVALHANIRRYTVGVESNAIDPGLDAEWWWPAAPTPLLVWVLGSLAFALALTLLALALSPARSVDGGTADAEQALPARAQEVLTLSDPVRAGAADERPTRDRPPPMRPLQAKLCSDLPVADPA